MSDELKQLVARLRNEPFSFNAASHAADAIEALMAERDSAKAEIAEVYARELNALERAECARIARAERCRDERAA